MTGFWQWFFGALIVGPMLAGCQFKNEETISPLFGNAVRTNTALMVINPDAGQHEIEPTPLDGQKAEVILDEYRTESGEVEDTSLVDDVGS